jgi:hypothetical protein
VSCPAPPFTRRVTLATGPRAQTRHPSWALLGSARTHSALRSESGSLSAGCPGTASSRLSARMGAGRHEPGFLRLPSTCLPRLARCCRRNYELPGRGCKNTASPARSCRALRRTASAFLPYTFACGRGACDSNPTRGAHRTDRDGEV